MPVASRQVMHSQLFEHFLTAWATASPGNTAVIIDGVKREGRQYGDVWVAMTLVEASSRQPDMSLKPFYRVHGIIAFQLFNEYPSGNSDNPAYQALGYADSITAIMQRQNIGDGIVTRTGQGRSTGKNKNGFHQYHLDFPFHADIVEPTI